MTKAVLEAESEGAAEQRARSYSIAVHWRPASLHASLMARLDRLGPAKEVAQIGAAIGREFSHALLLAVVAQAGGGTSVSARPSHCGRFAVPAGRAAARDLSCSNTPWCRTRPTAPFCASRDARFMLVSLKPSKASSRRLPRTRPEFLARHCTEAGLIEKAAGLWGKAGQRSLERSALVEAQRSSRAPSTRLRPCPLRRRYVASRSSFRSR